MFHIRIKTSWYIFPLNYWDFFYSLSGNSLIQRFNWILSIEYIAFTRKDTTIKNFINWLPWGWFPWIQFVAGTFQDESFRSKTKTLGGEISIPRQPMQKKCHFRSAIYLSLIIHQQLVTLCKKTFNQNPNKSKS